MAFNFFRKGPEEGRHNHGQQNSKPSLDNPGIIFKRTDTTSESIVHPPTGFSVDNKSLSPPSAGGARSRSPSVASITSDKIRESLHLGHRRRRSTNSANVPSDLPNIKYDGIGDSETQWEERATKLATANGRPKSMSILTKTDDERIQEAIRLHEAGELSKSAEIFSQLADPNGPNNPLSQVLYGLALRHGWGVEEDLEKAMIYLRAAAQNSAAVEEAALRAGMKKGGSAKGELVLAIFELGNCFRQGWGVEKDPYAAKEYYETAANLGDADAQNEVAWCYLEGFGCKKDKKKAAMFYRRAEKQGNKILGNSWIYKDKYMGED
ncbi:hypothetical protein RUND412_001950 [Rhizina undulata]